MKKQILFNCIRSCWLIAILILPACGSYVLEEEDAEEESSSKGYQMSLHVRSGGISLEQYYPLTVLLFNEEGELVEKLKLQIPRKPIQRYWKRRVYPNRIFRIIGRVLHSP